MRLEDLIDRVTRLTIGLMNPECADVLEENAEDLMALSASADLLHQTFSSGEPELVMIAALMGDEGRYGAMIDIIIVTFLLGYRRGLEEQKIRPGG